MSLLSTATVTGYIGLCTSAILVGQVRIMHTGVTGSSLVLLEPVLTIETEQLQLHAGHIIHHSSMDYNFSVGVRGGAFDIAHVRNACNSAAAKRARAPEDLINPICPNHVPCSLDGSVTCPWLLSALQACTLHIVRQTLSIL